MNYASNSWYLAEGSSKWGFECWLLAQNPNSKPASVTVTYMIEGGASKTMTKTINPNSRYTWNMANDIGQADASIRMISSQPIIAERSMYRNNRREGHDSIGVVAPANDFQPDVWISGKKRRDDVRQHKPCGADRDVEPECARGLITERVDDIQRRVDLRQGWTEPFHEAFACLRRNDTARGAMEQADTYPDFQPANRLAQARCAQAEETSPIAKAPSFGDCQKCI